MAKVFVRFPKVGLGNMMLVWARAVVFARLNDIPETIPYWWGFRIGPFLRNEKQKRFYWGYFKESSVWGLMRIYLYGMFSKKVYEPELRLLNEQEKISRMLFVFSKFEIDKDLFGYIRSHSKLVKAELFRLLSPKLKNIHNNSETPSISIHVRRGDFKLGTTLTPISYFVDIILMIRQIVGKSISVTVFTDALKDEISAILSLPDVHMSNNKYDILDILSMSESEILVLSGSSTFSYWGAFLSDALVIRPHDWQALIKKNEGDYYEVQWDGSNLKTRKEIEIEVYRRYKNIS